MAGSSPPTMPTFANSILEPDKRVVSGYEPLMPSFDGLVGDDEILRLTAYIRSLKGKGGTG